MATKFRNPSYAMYLADEKRIATARAAQDCALQLALVGCPSNMGIGTWLQNHANAILREGYEQASAKREAAEDEAIARGTMYRASFGLLTRVAW